MKIFKNSAGFTFAETLAAMLFVAIVIPVAMEGITIANKAGTVANRKWEAAQLADNLLNEMVITDDWRYGSSEGDFGEDWPGYKWTLEDSAWEDDSMRVVTVIVYYKVQEKEYSVSLSTLVEETEEE